MAAFLRDAHASPPTHASSSPRSSIDRLMLFDAYGAESFTPLASSSSAGSLPAHDALMAFLAEMEALDRDDEQQSETSSNCTVETETAVNDAITNEELQPDNADIESVKTVDDEPVTLPLKAPARQSPRKPARVAATAVTNEPKPEKKKRIRAKQEIDMLREDAETLQRQLEILQATVPQQSLEGADTDRASMTASEKPKKKAKLRHVGAVEQNRQLRKLVKTQLRYSKQIENVLTAKIPDSMSRSILISDNVVTQTPLSKADLVVFYEALTGSLDKLYTQLDDVFADADGLIKAQMQQKQQFSDAKLVVDDHKNVTIQLRDMKTLPFSFDAVTSSMSKILKEQSVKEGDGADEFLVAENDDVMLMRRGLIVQLEEDEPQVEIPTRAVSKRFLSKDRMVFCWDGTTDWPTPPHMLVSNGESVSMHEKGWAVIKPVPGASGMCTIQMCMLMKPGLLSVHMLETITREEIEEGIGKVVIPTYQQAFVSRYQMLENQLMDDHLKR